MTTRYLDTFRIIIHGDWCVYCGEWATDWDHFPPKSAGPYGVLLPTCRQCNLFAGTSWPYNLGNRVQLVHTKIARRYRRVLATPDWEDEEIEELRGQLKTRVKTWVELKRIVQRRLAWNAVSYLACIDRGKHFVPWNAETGTTLDIEPNLFTRLMRYARNRRPQKIGMYDAFYEQRSDFK